MGWPPAVIIVVRHGARLDAADKQWHLTSPTPYDPPLTYGGWIQSRALGARIANILRTRETDDEIPVANGANGQNGGDRRRKRRHKVIIHTSPFLRCVQTSVAISAGLAQNPGHTQQKPSSSPAMKPTQMNGSPRLRPLYTTGSPRLAPIQEPSNSSKVNSKSTPPEQAQNIKKATVRVDAFLGEWLTPDYFELITPPPSSVMMVAGSKADLLRREDYSNLIHVQEVTKAPQGFPGGWGSPVVAAEKDKDEGALSSLSSLGASLPRRDRTSSLSSVGSARSSHSYKSPVNLQVATPAEYGVYIPPVPSYAISNSDPIPPGYVAHARDACVDVDYQWDSMREPQNWGTGGEYGEEWSQMHQRFRTGIQSLLGWYATADGPGRLLTRTPKSPTHPSMTEEETPEDEDTDLVVILVTHGAGCNALIGALTNQPVLLDVGMASLTMAVRKPTPLNSPLSSPGASPNHSRVSSRNLTISNQYDVKLVANTEHLRTSAASTPASSRPPSLAGISTFHDRFTGNSLDGSNFNKAKTGVTTSSAFGSIRRTASIASSIPRSYPPARQSSIGLWSAPQAQEEGEDAAEEPEDDMILNFGDDAATDFKRNEEKENPAVTIMTEKRARETFEEREDDVAPLGLWGAPRPPGYAEKIREITPKRRWTVNERA